jgi:peptidyl-prolyl cis-trans isomerase B (cyclophilin B)
MLFFAYILPLKPSPTTPSAMKFVVILLAGLVLVSCNRSELERLSEQNRLLRSQVSDLSSELETIKTDAENMKSDARKLEFLSTNLRGITATIVTNKGEISLEFFPDKAPIHCFNFITRAESGFYDNTQFHRVIPGFMIQGGDPNSRDGNKFNNGQGGPIASIPHEFNDTVHAPGVLSMARVGDKSYGAGSQFFIMHAERNHLDGEYTAFGRVTSGMDVVNAIATTATHADDPRLRDHPVDPVIIRTIRVRR